MSVTLGFAEESEPWLLKSCYLPVMKIGGKPAWLDLKNIPNAEDVACGHCKEPCIFLCQIYASDEQNPQAFHRSLFVFICRKGACCRPNSSDNLRVFRSQVPHANEFYPLEPLDPDEDDPPEKSNVSYWTKVCRVCNIKAPSHCKKCQQANYCCRRHQVVDWKAGHDKVCAKLADLGLKEEIKAKSKNKSPDQEEEEEEETYKGFLFPEYEIESEDEPADEDNDNDDDDGKKEKEEMEKLKKMMAEKKAGCLQDVEDKQLEEAAKEDDDEAFTEFKERIKRRPAQVLRYQRGGDPLLVSKENKPQKIPPCENCNSRRTFEFQIMPQLLNKLNCSNENSIDWGVLLVYTCEKSCLISGYQREFIWKQDYTDTENKNSGSENKH
ncbi:programmed cell death protein 2-like [Cotesia glomerata]|uniref:MYND-type domain-containing protein n=1 Tax=Cotesia glomerata TaxID=32391 RepID=A0AAV7HVN1_COTGL|nr:programmed cell death protein 2-like [Cotesia glomerata]KAH0534527.1 hypothetical protein KQX54_004828 [Cotesia glomerata]